MVKFLSPEEAVGLITDGMTLGISGFGGFSSADAFLEAMGKSFAEKNTPRDLTIVSGVAPGDFNAEGCGMSKIKAEGIVDTLYASHLRMSPPIGKAVSENKIAAYSIPLGVYAQLMAAIGSKRPGVLTHIGLGTYADPRQEGCQINDLAKKRGRKVVELMQVDGKDYLLYKSFKIDACVIRASYADEDGNISVEDEPIRDAILELATAVHNTGGFVIAEVKDVVKRGSLDPRHVMIHKKLVNYVVKGVNKDNLAQSHNPGLNGAARLDTKGAVKAQPFDYRKVITRRAALELEAGMLVNLGIGIPDGVSTVANEEGVSDKVTFSIETGVYGGVAMGGPLFGSSMNPECISRSSDIFNVYDGGGLDMTVLGCAEIGANGNVNVSRFSGRCVGPGGFINISQNTPKVCFAFSFTAGKQDIVMENGKLIIREDGNEIKFKKDVEQITFSSAYAQETNQTIYFITERAVFQLIDQKLVLIEIAPGVDLQKHILDKMEFAPEVSMDLKLMDARLFCPEKMGMSI